MLSEMSLEEKKLEICKKYGADAVMDLSTGGDLDQIREHVVAHLRILFQHFIQRLGWNGQHFGRLVRHHPGGTNLAREHPHLADHADRVPAGHSRPSPSPPTVP